MQGRGFANHPMGHSAITDGDSQATRLNRKEVELKDEWETFTVRFSVNAPQASENSSKEAEIMRIFGSLPGLTKAGSVGSGPKQMRKSRRKFRWLYDKYGQEMRPWECQIKVKMEALKKVSQIIYGYSKSSGDEFIYEREPSRILKIQ